MRHTYAKMSPSNKEDQFQIQYMAKGFWTPDQSHIFAEHPVPNLVPFCFPLDVGEWLCGFDHSASRALVGS